MAMFGMDDNPGDEVRKAKRLELRNKMADLYEKAKNENIITELELDPVDDTQLRNLGVSNTHFNTIIGFANKTRPLEEFKKTVKLFKKDWQGEMKEYLAKKRVIDDEIHERKMVRKRAEQARQRQLEKEKKEQKEQ